MTLPFSTLILAEQVYQYIAEEYAKPCGWDIALDEEGTITLYDSENGNTWVIKVTKTFAGSPQ